MAYYIVFDTNILVSALMSKHDDSATVVLVSKMIQGEVIPVYSKEIMEEYRQVLNRPKFKFDPSLVRYLLSVIQEFGLCIEPFPTGEVLPDMKDLPFYEVVYEKKEEDEDTYLVTGNLKHFPIKPFIVTARQMLEIIAQNQRPPHLRDMLPSRQQVFII